MARVMVTAVLTRRVKVIVVIENVFVIARQAEHFVQGFVSRKPWSKSS